MARTICSKCTEPVVSGGLCRKHYDAKRRVDEVRAMVSMPVDPQTLHMVAAGVETLNKYQVRSLAIELERYREGLIK